MKRLFILLATVTLLGGCAGWGDGQMTGASGAQDGTAEAGAGMGVQGGMAGSDLYFGD